MPSQPRIFFERITTAADPVAEIRALINPDDPTLETDWLDFKTEHHDPKQRDKDNRKCWSENLSAFANTGGGVLIWGLDARPMKIDGREIDCVQKEIPVADPIGLAAKLVGWQGQATDPALAGVEVKGFRLPGDAERGFVVCFIPEGPHKPYQSTQTTDKQYYQRGGASGFVMPRAVLASMFYPRSRAAFTATAEVSWHDDRGHPPAGFMSGGRMNMSLFFTNGGTATAREVFFRIYTRGMDSGVQIGGSGYSQKFLNGPPEWAFSTKEPLHPKMTLGVCGGEWVLTPAMRTQLVLGALPEPTLLLTVYCEHQEPEAFSLAFDMNRIFQGERVRIQSMPGTV